jgi:hypothetical protein
MSHHTTSAKSRTVALPNINKGLPAHPIQAKLNGRISTGDGALSPMVFGPYLVPLSRRAE